jgi:hypothetical protein
MVPGMWHDLMTSMSVAGQVCLGVVFCLAAIHKFRYWAILPGVISNYRLLPRALVAPAAASLPPLEMIVGIALLSGLEKQWAAPAAILLLGVFAVAMGINLYRGRTHIDCGCGQLFLKQTLSWILVARNVVLALLLLPCLAITGPVPAAVLVTGACAGLAFAMLYVLVNTISALPKTGAMPGRPHSAA